MSIAIHDGFVLIQKVQFVSKFHFIYIYQSLLVLGLYRSGENRIR